MNERWWDDLKVAPLIRSMRCHLVGVKCLNMTTMHCRRMWSILQTVCSSRAADILMNWDCKSTRLKSDQPSDSVLDLSVSLLHFRFYRVKPWAGNKNEVTLSITHTDAAHGDDGKRSQDSCCANNPGETQKENHTKNVLHAGQVNPNEGSHLGYLEMCRNNKGSIQDKDGGSVSYFPSVIHSVRKMFTHKIWAARNWNQHIWLLGFKANMGTFAAWAKPPTWIFRNQKSFYFEG